jgi:hypothetical protein
MSMAESPSTGVQPDVVDRFIQIGVISLGPEPPTLSTTVTDPPIARSPA